MPSRSPRRTVDYADLSQDGRHPDRTTNLKPQPWDNLSTLDGYAWEIKILFLPLACLSAASDQSLVTRLAEIQR